MDQARAPYMIDLTEAVRDGRSLASVQAEVEREMIRLAMIHLMLRRLTRSSA